MVNHIRPVLLFTVLSIMTFAIACSSSDESAPASAPTPDMSDDRRPTPVGGQEETTGELILTQQFDMGIEVTSPVFNRIRRIPKTYVCKGKKPRAGASFEQNAQTKYLGRINSSPPLEWTGIPDGTQSIALIMDSNQLPGERWVHWLLWNLPSNATGLPERVATTTDVVALGANTRQGINDDKTLGYSGPCPSPVSDIMKWGSSGQAGLKLVFNYVFTVYALDIELDLPGAATVEEFMQAIDGHILSGGKIKGEFLASKQIDG